MAVFSGNAMVKRIVGRGSGGRWPNKAKTIAMPTMPVTAAADAAIKGRHGSRLRTDPEGAEGAQAAESAEGAGAGGAGGAEGAAGARGRPPSLLSRAGRFGEVSP